MDFSFILNSILLGIGLAMDAFSISIANALNDNSMKKSKMIGIAGTFAFFQFLMPMIGWICVHTIVEYFKTVNKFIPLISLIILVWIGTKMIIECVRKNKTQKSENKNSTKNDLQIQSEKKSTLSAKILLIQGIATSLDALSVGFTIASYKMLNALCASLIIAIVTFFICMTGLVFGKKIGQKLKSAEIFGGIILIIIGIEIFVKSLIN